MCILNRIGLFIFFPISFVVLLALSIVSPKYAMIYLIWITKIVKDFLYGEKENI